MTTNRKMVSPLEVGTLGKTASEYICRKNTSCISVCQSAAAQRQQILEYLKHGAMSTLQARSMGIMHPGMRVCELRKQGHEIATEWVNEYCPGGVLHRIARYTLKQVGADAE